MKKIQGGCLLDHLQFLNEIYPDRHKMAPIFDIATPFKMDQEAQNSILPPDLKKRKRKRKRQAVDKPFSALELRMQKMLSHLFTNQESPPKELILDNNKKARNSAMQCMSEATEHYPNSDICGQNSNAHLIEMTIKDRIYILPPKSEFLSMNVQSCLAPLENRKFQAILMDPPWQNKHVKRQKMLCKSYKMLENDDIFSQLPNMNLLLQDNGFLFIWCTNSSRHFEAIQSWLQKWDLQMKTVWYWLKVTKFGETVTPWNHPHKKPYERLGKIFNT